LHEEAKAIESAVRDNRISVIDEKHAGFIEKYRHLISVIDADLKASRQ
jgi:hypothetical protein